MNHLEKVTLNCQLTGYNATVKALCFDMDGTIADLYGVENWKALLDAHDASPYINAKPMVNTTELVRLLNKAIANGIEVRIITWLAMNSNAEYDELVRLTKQVWLAQHNIPYTHFHGVKFGTTKADCVRKELDWQELETAVLFDDNEKVRKGWKVGQAYEPAKIIEILKKVVGE